MDGPLRAQWNLDPDMVQIKKTQILADLHVVAVRLFLWN